MLKLVRKIDQDTGEVYSEKKQFIEDVLTPEGYRVPAHKAGAKIFNNIPLPRAMTYTEKGRMVDLARHMIQGSNMLGYRSGGSILPYTEQHLINLVELSQRRGKPFIQKMIGLGVMQKVVRKYAEVESAEFYINPAYFFAGKRISFNLYLLFREHLDPILPGWVRQEFLRQAKTFEDKAGRGNGWPQD